MTRLREEFDADRAEETAAATRLQDDVNKFELVCSTCGRTVFTDEATHSQAVRAMEIDPDNQFICDDCDEFDEEFAHSAP